MGGNLPLGYDVQDRKLVVNEPEAESVRTIFRRYLDRGCVRTLKSDLVQSGIRSKSGGSFSRGALYALLANPIYVGEIRHKDARYPGHHQTIVDRELWDAVQARLTNNGPDRRRVAKVAPGPLIGKLFDEAGERLTPSHAAKNGRRYRYHVSRSLVVGTAEQQAGWRLPAQEIERVVADAVRTFLADRGAVSTAVREAGLAPERVPFLLDALGRWNGDPLALVHRVDLGTKTIHVSLTLDSLAGESNLVVAWQVPMTIRRRGVEMRLVIDGTGRAASKAAPTLMKAIVRARGWFDDLVSGRASSLTAIAAREGITDRYVSHLLPLAFLAPDIVGAIVAGRQPADLTVQSLVRRTNLPLGWDEQNAVLGFA